MARGNKKGKGKGSSGQNRKSTDNYFDKMKNKPGFVLTESGMLYCILDKHEGESPDTSSMVTVNQRISLVDGTMVADTYKGLPDSFPMSEAIEGYREGLLMMGVGDRFKFIIPPELAWGKKGAGKKIGPDATLIIDVRLESL